MPFVVCSATKEFQRRMNIKFGNVKERAVIAADLLVSGKGAGIDTATKIHTQNLRNTPQRASDSNLRFHRARKNCVFYIRHL